MVVLFILDREDGVSMCTTNECTCAVPCEECSCSDKTAIFQVEELGILDCYSVPGCIGGHYIERGNAMFLAISSPKIGHSIAKILPIGCCRVESVIGADYLIVGACESPECVGVLRELRNVINNNGGIISDRIVQDVICHGYRPTYVSDDTKVFSIPARLKVRSTDLHKEISYGSLCDDQVVREYYRSRVACL